VAKSSSVSRRLYLDVKDTLAEVGITRRQLGHWEDKGLLKPELGVDSKRYTESDLDRLKVLKKLIVDQRLPLDFVAQLAERADESFFGPELGATQYLDIEANEMKSKEELSLELWQEFLLTADESDLEDRLYELWLIIGRVLKAKYRTDASYKGRRDELRRISSGMEFTARIEWETDEDGDIVPRLSPHLEERGYSFDDLASWVNAQRYRISTLHAVGDRLITDGSLTRDQQRRLWNSSTIQAVHNMIRPEKTPQLSQEEIDENMDDVPF
jgi:DNA-binding transcriptional MerR regulator